MTRLEEGEDGIRGCLRWHLAGTAMIPKEDDREKTRTGSVQGAWPLFKRSSVTRDGKFW